MPNPFNSDDTNLIEKFVQGSNQLLANERVRIETVGNASQIMARTGEVLAVMYLHAQPRTALVKVNSIYADLLDAELQEQDFVSIGQGKRPGYLEYCQYVVPAGYKTYYTEPALLWKKWWPTERFKNKQRFNMNILVRMKDNWYPVQNIVVDAGTFTVKTLAGQVDVSSGDRILWLSQIPKEDTIPVAIQNDVWEKSPEVRKFENKQEPLPALPAIQNPVAPPPPPVSPKKLQELEMRLYKQQQSTIAAEQRAIQAEQRAKLAEQQLALLQTELPQNESEVNWIY